MAKFVNKKIGEPLDVEATIKFDGLTQPSGFTVIFVLETSAIPYYVSFANYVLVRIENNGVYKIKSTFDTSKMEPRLYRLRVLVRDVERIKLYADKTFYDVVRLSY
jgi:hypothetical protein